MIKDERDIRAAPNQFRYGWQLLMSDADVERVSILGQQLHPLHECCLEAIARVAFPLQIAAYTLDQGSQLS